MSLNFETDRFVYSFFLKDHSPTIFCLEKCINRDVKALRAGEGGGEGVLDFKQK